MEPEPEPEHSRVNRHTTPIILPLPLSISQLMGNMIVGPLFINSDIDNHDIDNQESLEDIIQNQSFHQDNKYKKVCDIDFINSLSVQKTTTEMVEHNITCGICLEPLKEGDNIIELPCTDKHYFHTKNEGCPGIYPWLKNNDTCPLCRHEFPSIEKEIEQTESTIPENRPLRPINLMNIINSAIEEQEDRMLQEAIYQSMNPTINQETNDYDENI